MSRPLKIPARISRRDPDAPRHLSEPWQYLRWRIEEGEHPQGADIVAAGRQQPMPDLAEYVVSRLDGTITRPSGRQPATTADLVDARMHAADLHCEVVRFQVLHRRKRRPRRKEGVRDSPKVEAMKAVAKRYDMSRHTLRDKIRDRLSPQLRHLLAHHERRRTNEGGETPE